ncbi:MAG: hypothetical protein ISS56_07985 [Anaerolineae bacterium]|nr:hypothetical protein [Anaerolineae bacterium]
MEEFSPKLTVTDLLGYMIAYLCWILVAGIGMASVLIARNTLNLTWGLLGGNRWLLRPIDRFGLVFMGLAWLVYVIFVEQHFRSAISVVRDRRMRIRLNHETKVREVPPSNKVMRVLYRCGLHILARRVVLMTTIPLSFLLLSYLVEELSLLIVGG